MEEEHINTNYGKCDRCSKKDNLSDYNGWDMCISCINELNEIEEFFNK